MSDAIFQRSVEVAVKPVEARPLPVGYGLLLGALISLGLWAGAIWLVLGLIA